MNFSFRNRFHRLPAVLLLAGVFNISALSEDSVADSLEYVLPELNIVAVKQGERLRREGVSSTSIGRVELERLNAPQLRGLSEVVPNFYVPDYGSRVTSSIYVRGIGARMDNPSVGLLIDNLPVMNKDAFDLDVPDMVYVEMLRGPQSSLYGRNTMAGMINIATLSPFRFQGWKLNLSAGNGGSLRGSLGWYHKFNPKLAFSATLNGEHLRGFFRNRYDGKYCDGENSGGLRLKLMAHPSESIALQNVASTSLLRQGGYPYRSVATGEISYNDECHYNRFTFADALTINKYHEHFTATSVTSLQYLDNDLMLDQDFLPLSYFTLNQKKKEWSVTEDIVMRSPSDDSPYHWLGGISGFWKHLDMSAPVVFKDEGIKKLIESHRNDANPYHPISWGSREFSLGSDFGNPTWGVALYHESKYSFGPFRLSAAIRFDYERASLSYHSLLDTEYGIYSNPGRLPYDDPSVVASWPLERVVDVSIDDRGRLSRDFFTILPSVSLLWQLPDDVSNLYLQWSRGSKSGGFNTQMFSDVLQQRLMGIMGIGASYNVDDIVGYRPEASWNYEFGGHFNLVGDMLTADFALFFIDCRDQQLTMFPDGTTTGRIMTNAGRTHSFGGEVSLNWTPVNNLNFLASYGYTNARFREFFDGITDYSGKYLPYVPSNTLYIQGVWRLAVGRGERDHLSVEVNLRGTGSIYWNESNTLRQPFYLLLGGSLAWERPNWSLSLWGRNLSDTRYDTFYFMSMGNEFLQQGKPLQVGVTYTMTI